MDNQLTPKQLRKIWATMKLWLYLAIATTIFTTAINSHIVRCSNRQWVQSNASLLALGHSAFHPQLGHFSGFSS
jgi:hypothetical protein